MHVNLLLWHFRLEYDSYEINVPVLVWFLNNNNKNFISEINDFPVGIVNIKIIWMLKITEIRQYSQYVKMKCAVQIYYIQV